MNAMIMAAGMGTRLKPWTLSHPKALVPVDGVPALERLIYKLRGEGFGHVTVNVHHFAGQIVDYLGSKDFGIDIEVSDESEALLDTGGGIAKCGRSLVPDGKPLLVHNADILSNACLKDVVKAHEAGGADVTLLTSGRDSSRRLVFDDDGQLRGWHNMTSGEWRPEGFIPRADMHANAFSGIYVLSPRAIDDIVRYEEDSGKTKFSVMEYFLSLPTGISIREHYDPELQLLDIGKPETLARASEFLRLCQRR